MPSNGAMIFECAIWLSVAARFASARATSADCAASADGVAPDCSRVRALCASFDPDNAAVYPLNALLTAVAADVTIARLVAIWLWLSPLFELFKLFIMSLKSERKAFVSLMVLFACVAIGGSLGNAPEVNRFCQFLRSSLMTTRS